MQAPHRTLKELCSVPADQRIGMIDQIFESHGVSFHKQQDDSVYLMHPPFLATPRTGRPLNFVVEFGEDPGEHVFGAHHDISQSTLHGANDNSAACAQLINTAIRLTEEDYNGNLTIVLWDLEEPDNMMLGRPGAGYWAARQEYYQPVLCVVLDMVGIGNNICISDSFYSYEQAAVFKASLDKLGIAYEDKVPSPWSDNSYLVQYGIESILVFMLPDADESVITERARDLHRRAHWSNIHSHKDDIDTIEYSTIAIMENMLYKLAKMIEGKQETRTADEEGRSEKRSTV